MSLPYQLWRKVIPQLALAVSFSPQEASILQEIAPDIHALTGHAPIDIPQAGGDADQQRLIATLIAILRRLDRPTVLLLEDLHWTRESLTVLQQIAPLINEKPLLIVGTYRIEDKPDLPSQLPHAQLVRLQALSEAEMTQLGATMLGSDEGQSDLFDVLQQETGGNPLFVVEMLRALAEEAGTLSDVARQTLPLGVFMQGFQRVIEERLKRIPAHLQAVLRLASALGREINLALLEAQFEQERVQEWLMIATDNAILEVTDNRWFFSHAEIRETVLEVLTDDERREVHRQAAKAIESLHGDDPAYAALLVDHWKHTGDDTKLYRYARDAAEFAFARGLLEPAQTFAEQALSVAEVEIDANKVIALRLMLGEVLSRRGDYDRAIKTYRTVVATSIQRNDPRNQAWGMTQLGWIHLRQSSINTARDHCLPALRLAKESEDAEVLGLALRNLGFISMNAGDFENAVNYFNRSLAYVRKINKTPEIASVLNALGLVYLIQGYNREAYQYFAESLTYFEQLDDRWNMAVELHNQGAALTNMGDYVAADASFKRALELDESINDNVGVVYHLSYLANIALNDENYVEAMRYINRMDHLLKAIKDRKLQSSMARTMGWTHLYQRDFEKAEQCFNRALAINTELGHQPTIIVSKVSLAWSWLLQAKWQNALDTLQEVIAEVSESGDRWTTAETYNGIALALHHLGEDHDRAVDYLRRSITLMRPLGGVPLILEALVIYAQVCAETRRDDAAAWCYLVIGHRGARTVARQLSQATLDAMSLSADERDSARERATDLDFDTVIDGIVPNKGK